MRFALTIETSVGVTDEKANLIINLSNELSEYFLNREYGNAVIKLLIGVICVAPEFEFFTKVRKPKYTSYRKYINQDGIEIIEDRIFCFDVKLDYEKFRSQKDEENRKILASEILGSLSNLDALPKKVKDFDKNRFKNDMRTFFDEKTK